MPRHTRIYLAKLALLAAAYVSVAYLSLFLIPSGGSGASLVWPVSAIGLGALVLFGFDLWPALLVPFFVLLLARGVEPPVAAGVALGNALEAVVGAWILRRFDFSPMLWRLQDALVLVLAAVLACLLSASIIAASFSAFTGSLFDSQLAVGLWIGHVVSVITFGPFVIRWGYKPYFTRTRNEWIEGVLVFAAFVILNTLLYWTPYSSLGSISLLYVAIIPLIWAALRTGPRGMSLALIMMAVIAATGILFGHSIVRNGNFSQVLFSVQLIIGILSLIFLLFSSIVEERKEAVNAMHSHVDKLEDALDKIRLEDQAKADFIAILAHELRNPLSPLLSGLELLKARGQGDQDIVQMMGAHLHTMARLLDDLLDISRVSQKKFKVRKQPVTFDTVITQTLEMVHPHIIERRHTLTTSLPEGPVWLDGDPVRLAQIFVNLLSNAAKYTDPGGTIRLIAERRGSDLVVEVSDTGIGISEDRLKKVFEPFGVGDAGRGAQGLHIGLSLARRMAEIHQGTLEAYSAGRGRGSRFVVCLPLMPVAPLPLPAEAPRGRRSRFSKAAIEEAARKTGSLQILVVDDNEAAAASLGKLLELNGHSTRIAHDAEQALETLKTLSPQVALLDIGLPTMDGYELAARLRQRFGDEIMLVALTGYGQSEDKQKARDAGFDEHLTKPVSIVDIERVLAELSRK